MLKYRKLDINDQKEVRTIIDMKFEKTIKESKKPPQ
jgi:hypothetical protein